MGRVGVVTSYQMPRLVPIWLAPIGASWLLASTTICAEEAAPEGLLLAAELAEGATLDVLAAADVLATLDELPTADELAALDEPMTTADTLDELAALDVLDVLATLDVLAGLTELLLEALEALAGLLEEPPLAKLEVVLGTAPPCAVGSEELPPPQAANPRYESARTGRIVCR